MDRGSRPGLAAVGADPSRRDARRLSRSSTSFAEPRQEPERMPPSQYVTAANTRLAWAGRQRNTLRPGVSHPLVLAGTVKDLQASVRISLIGHAAGSRIRPLLPTLLTVFRFDI